MERVEYVVRQKELTLEKVPIDCIGKCVAVIYDGLSTKHLIERCEAGRSKLSTLHSMAQNQCHQTRDLNCKKATCNDAHPVLILRSGDTGESNDGS